MIKQFILAIAVAALTSGCTSIMGLGSDEYACKGMPNNPTCMSAKDVYAATEGDDYKTQLKSEQEGASTVGGKQTVNAPTRVLVADPSDNAPIPMRSRNPLPIRSQAVVMRIAVDPWEDERGDLYVPGYVYTEVEARRWEIGARNPKPMPVLRPLKIKEPVVEQSKKK
ncbi:type IV conjugative transfer system lipoprotein TraV [Pseudomonas tolaasii]|uniref:type IV conjugative transfer system lipoprotein TraV n=1 Tax=Pseudomonas TaxID=286 RepID=UPI0009B980A9|nr:MULTISPECIES: type IV conjugative transfer system lipoprotein TraV [Pseudomonas]MCT8950426.1 type IV conjugative transfer system lipoprotein TraV [Pseudomonas iridis]NVZ46129.1 type IV conjugative transfer system lipoprotein TraV [Pseudomonas tolaasii]NWA51776.1 type IV conjugative transfer system lipoprotein TraV [Pseudomonas tolaasii]